MLRDISCLKYLKLNLEVSPPTQKSLKLEEIQPINCNLILHYLLEIDPIESDLCFSMAPGGKNGLKN